MVPAYPKMRVPFFAMHDWLARLMKMFTTLRLPFQNNGLNVASLSWDLRLQQVNEFKSDLRQGGFWENQISASFPKILATLFVARDYAAQ